MNFKKVKVLVTLMIVTVIALTACGKAIPAKPADKVTVHKTPHIPHRGTSLIAQ